MFGEETQLGGVAIGRQQLYHGVGHRRSQLSPTHFLGLRTAVPMGRGFRIGPLLPVGPCIVLHHSLPVLMVGHLVLQSIQRLLQGLKQVHRQWSTDDNTSLHPHCGSHDEVPCCSEVATVRHLVGLSKGVSHLAADLVELNLINAVRVNGTGAELVPYNATRNHVLTQLAGEDVKVLHTAGDKGEILWILKSPVSRNQELDKDAFLLLAVCVVGRACVVCGGRTNEGLRTVLICQVVDEHTTKLSIT